MHACICVCVCIYIYVCVCVYVCICVCAFINVDPRFAYACNAKVSCARGHDVQKEIKNITCFIILKIPLDMLVSTQNMEECQFH